MQRPQRFTLVKSFASMGSITNDLLAGLPVADVNLARVRFLTATNQPAIELTFASRPAFANYRRWVKEQGIEHVAAQFTADLPLVAGEPNVMRIRVANRNNTHLDGDVTINAPPGWRVEPAGRRVRLPTRGEAGLEFRVTPPAGLLIDGELTAMFTASGVVAEVKSKGHPVPQTRVARVKSSPSLDGTTRGWETLSVLAISPTNLVQGKVADEADSSATFRLAHDGKTLFVDVQVKDDVVVTNIAPNDIKGHWRSDSVEICLDPIGGSEHTMGCYKLGIFPFDTTGVVRAARDADANQGPVEETAPKTRLISRRSADGYRIQAAIPFDEIGLPRGKKRLGFNLIIYDGDKRDAAPGENINKSRIAWAPRSGVQGRPEDWGRIDLE